MTGKRDSEWRVIKRCLALLQRLMRGDAPTHELLDLVRNFDEDGASASPETLQSRLEGDLQRLRTSLDFDIRYIDRQTGYRLEACEFPLIDVSDMSIEALAFLEQTFSGSDIPQRDAVLRLVRDVSRVLPTVRRDEIARARSGLEVSLRSRDAQPVDAELIEKLTAACYAHREIMFAYRSPRQADAQPRVHRVQPMRCYLDSVHHHYMLEAYYLETSGPTGTSLGSGVRTYRLERMSDLQILPKHFVPRMLRDTGVELVYVLSPDLARLRDVTGFIEGSTITYEGDGSAIVRAQSRNLLMDLKRLLKYGAECQVIGGEQAAHDMRAMIRAMAGLYQIE